MREIKICPYSDDNIGYTLDGKGEELSEPEATFHQVPPTSTPLKFDVKVGYGSDGWEFRLELPQGTKLLKISRWSDQHPSDSDQQE